MGGQNIYNVQFLFYSESLKGDSEEGVMMGVILFLSDIISH